MQPSHTCLLRDASREFMSQFTNQHHLRTDQYRDASNLDARVQLHVRFSTNKLGWHRWVFDQFALPKEGDILELGCGPGHLWRENRERIPQGWAIVLADLSSGMVKQARQNLNAGDGPFRLAVSDARTIPFADERFDACIANHMLYHVPDIEAALAEIRRVLRPGGAFYASTVGRSHMHELYDLVCRFDCKLDPAGTSLPGSFLLENGEAQLSRWFSRISLYQYEDALAVTEAEPLAAYVASTVSQSAYVRGRLDAFTRFVEAEIARHGAIHITKTTGMLEGFRDDDS